MTEKQERWRKEAEWLKEHNCSLRDGTDMSKLTPKQKEERSRQLKFESQIICTASGNNGRGRAVNFTRKFA